MDNEQIAFWIYATEQVFYIRQELPTTVRVRIPKHNDIDPARRELLLGIQVEFHDKAHVEVIAVVGGKVLTRNWTEYLKEKESNIIKPL